eukprot:evm.model.scf_234.7 EVM.evm.TU.scf_234.7   scf_234:77935-79852(+)
MISDGLRTKTCQDQRALEQKLAPRYAAFARAPREDQLRNLTLLRTVHVDFLVSGLGRLPVEFICLDASRAWLVYWIVHSLALLDAAHPDEPSPEDVIAFLRRCQHPSGGYGGGPGQLPHLASSYAAVAAALTIGGPAALASVHRSSMFDFILRMCVPPESGGGMAVHEGGEVDVRGAYTGLAVAHMLGLDKGAIAERSGVVEYVKRCQTHEGGLGGEPGNEAHGGYTFCGLATLVLLGRADALDLPRLAHWVAGMQGAVEGGYMGRTNKLVDGCYSYWQGAVPALLRAAGGALAAQLPVPPFLRGWGGNEVVGDGGLDFDVPDVMDLPELPRALGPREQLREAQRGELERLGRQLAEALEEAERVGEEGGSEEGPDTEGIKESLQEAKGAMEAAEASASGFLTEEKAEELGTRLPVGEGGREWEWAWGNAGALQFWILRSCQSKKGGLRDKPGKGADYYHTCYCLSGLSVCQHGSGLVLGPQENLLVATDPVVNVVRHRLAEALQFFGDRPL